MKKLLILTILLVFGLVGYAYADTTNPLEFTEEDGSPSTFPYKVKFANGSVTDNGDGTTSIAGGGSSTPGGGPGNVQFNSAGSFGGGGNINWDDTNNRLRLSADGGQVGIAFVVSNDAGAVKANISYDGGATVNSLTLANRLSVDSGGTGLTSGTSGGVLAFTAAGTISSSNLLTASAVLVGGGSGAAPTAITADTATVGHFLASHAANPAFRQIQSGDMAGVFDQADGALGITAYTKGDLLSANASSQIVKFPVGSMGQMLSVDNGTTFGVKWVTSPSGGASPLTTKGDIWMYSNTDARFPVGSMGQILSVDTGATFGVAWVASPVSGGTKPPKEYWWPASATLPLEAADSIAAISRDQGTNVDFLNVAYDFNTDEGRTVTFRVPSDIDTTATVTFRAHWYANSVDGNVVWDFRHNSGVAEGVDPDAALTTEAAAADAVQNAVGKITQTTWTETVSNLGWAANDEVVGVFYRDANNASDNMGADALSIGFGVDIPRA